MHRAADVEFGREKAEGEEVKSPNAESAVGRREVKRDRMIRWGW